MRDVSKRSGEYRSRFVTYIMAFSVVFITVSTVNYPKEAFEAAVMGLNLWWNVVFPALLPFFILSEFMMGLGVVHFIGVLLEPLMRPLFNVPGVGAFALSMGLASGYPMDAVITSKFRKNQLCTAVEAERLLSFTNTADPLFMFGAVAVGMFAMPELGVTIAVAHYISSFLVGFCFRFHGRNRDIPSIEHTTKRAPGNIIIRAFGALYNARIEDKRSFGQLLGDTVRSSMNTILLIGGFIIVFSVFLRILSVVGATSIMSATAAAILNLVGFQESLASAIVSGIFEIDLGTMAAAQADAPLAQKLAVASAVIAWSGLCVHGQVASIVIESGIRMGPYIIGRCIHAILAAVLTVVFFQLPLQSYIPDGVFPALAKYHPGGSGLDLWWNQFTFTGYQFLIVVGILLIMSALYQIYRAFAQR